MLFDFLLFEVGIRPQFQRDPGERIGYFGQRQFAHAECRVMNDGGIFPDTFQDHEMLQIPVQDAGQPQIAQLVQVQLERTAGQLHLFGNLDQMQ